MRAARVVLSLDHGAEQLLDYGAEMALDHGAEQPLFSWFAPEAQMICADM